MYYTIYKDTESDWRWNLRSANHEIIAQGEGYSNKADCLAAIKLVKTSNDAPVKEQ
jgi:uncharacterized protein